MAIETTLAKASLDPTTRRNILLLDHPMTATEFKALAPSFGWDRYLEGVAAPTFTTLNVATPDFFKQLDRSLQQVPLPQWKAYLKWQFVHHYADALTKAIADEHFNFEGKVLGGAQENLPLWNRCVRAVDAALGEALGRIYVEQFFGGNAKERTLKMVRAIEAAMARDIKELDWMSEATKEKALTKLRAVANRIAYPDTWRDYSKLAIVRGDRLGNALRASAFESQRQLAKIGKPVDRNEWNTSPPTVNAYYSPLQNNITFRPASCSRRFSITRSMTRSTMARSAW
jgi:endothelin-converting enzyme/putative endopeptidase